MAQTTTRALLAMTIIGALLLPAASAAGEETKWTLRDLILQAIRSHEAVQIADSRIRRADADIRLVKSALLPRASFNGAYTFYADEQVIELSPGESFELRPAQDWNGSIDLRQTLFYGLRDWRARDIARLNRGIAQLDRSISINDLALEVAAAFYEALATEEGVEVRQLVLEANENQLKVAQRRYEVGEVAIAAVARFRSETAAARQALVVAQGDAALARNRLVRLVNLQDVGTLVAPGPVPIPEGGEQTLEQTALAERLEMRVLVEQLKAAGLYVKVEKGAALPELDAAAQYFTQKAGFPANDWLSLSLNLYVPIYQGGLVKANVAKAREDLREIELLEQTVRRTIEDQVDSSLLAFEAADAVLDAATERNKAARLSYRQVEAAYRVGEASTIDLLDATTEAADAETAQIIARAQRQFQAISLRYSIGLPPLPDLDFRTMSGADQQEN